MATRFYLPTTGTPTISPNFDSGWETTSSAVRRTLVTTKTNTSMASHTLTSVGTSDNEDILIRQYISAPLNSQTITGTLKGQIQADEANASSNFSPAIVVYIVSSDGSVVRGTLYSEFSDSTTTPPEFSAAAITNRMFPTGGAVSVTPVDALQDDRIVIELGARENSVPGSARTARMRMGDTGAVDLPEDNVATTQTLVPWIELSFDISFVGGASKLPLLGAG